MTKNLKQIEMVERFTIVDHNLPMPYLDVQFDGKTISIADLVSVANQLTDLLEQKGISFCVQREATH